MIDLYLQVREKEGRLYSDETVRLLPSVSPNHPLRTEWQARTVSAQWLAATLKHKPAPLTILELGCGNGWLSAYLAQTLGARVTGLDVNPVELAQAARVFGNRAGWVWGNIFQSPFAPNTFEVIVLASVIQYFPNLVSLITTLQSLLKPSGEIHIIDSPLYHANEVEAARQRSLRYYGGLGLPHMAEHYFQHTYNSLADFSPHWLFKPARLPNRVLHWLGRPSPVFDWVRLVKLHSN